MHFDAWMAATSKLSLLELSVSVLIGSCILLGLLTIMVPLGCILVHRLAGRLGKGIQTYALHSSKLKQASYQSTEIKVC